MLKLIIEDDEGRKTVVPFVRDEITIGRQEGNTIRLTERNVSRRHARLLRHSGAVKIEDLGSSNGIRVNGDRISGLVQVSDGDLIQIGDYDLAIQREEERLASAAASTPMQLPSARAAAAQTARLNQDQREMAPTLPALPAVEPHVSDETPPPQRPPEDNTGGAPRQQSTSVIRIDQVQSNRREVVELDSTQAPKLVVINTEFAGREFLISKNETRIGRVDDNDVYLDHRSLSRTHCKLVREDNGEWRVIDMQSANGLMVNGEPYAQVTLCSGDVIELGHVKMKFVGPGESSEAPTTAMTVDSAEFEQIGGNSKAPMIAVVATVLVLAIGGGGYALLRGQGTTKPPEVEAPVKPPVVAKVDPPVVPDDPTGLENPAPTEPSAEDVSKKALLDAQAALDVNDLATAESVLKGCRVGGVPCPEVSPMLAMVENEKKVAEVLKDAQSALERQDPAATRAQLDKAGSTKVFKARLTELEGKYTKLVADKKAAVVTVVPVKRDPVMPIAAPGLAAQTEKLATEAKAFNKSKTFPPALDRLKQCLRLDPNNLACIRLTASVYASISQNENSPEDLKRARDYYELYLKVAPPDDAYVDRIRNILSGAQ